MIPAQTQIGVKLFKEDIFMTENQTIGGGGDRVGGGLKLYTKAPTGINQGRRRGGGIPHFSESY